MTPAPSLHELIATVQQDSPSDDPLDLLATASTTVTSLSTVGDAVLDHFVAGARAQGRSWTEISSVLGVSKQAAHKRFSASRSGEVTFTLNAGNFSRFTDRARKVVAAATEVAKAWGHPYVGTEHLLAAQFTQPEAIAARVLAQHDITAEAFAAKVHALTPPGEAITDDQALPFTPRTQQALEGSLQAALDLGHNYIGTEHLLLGLFAVEGGLAVTVLGELGLTAEAARSDVAALLAALQQQPPKLAD